MFEKLTQCLQTHTMFEKLTQCLKNSHTQAIQLNREILTLRDRGGVELPKLSDYQRLALHMYLI